MGDIGFLTKLALAMILIASGGLACSIILRKNDTPGKGSIVGVTPNTTAIFNITVASISKANATYTAPENGTVYIAAAANATTNIFVSNVTYIVLANATQGSIAKANSTTIFAPNATKNSTDDWGKAKAHKTSHDDDGDGDGAFPNWALGLTCGLSVPSFFGCIFCVIWFREKLRIWCSKKDANAGKIKEQQSGVKEIVAAGEIIGESSEKQETPTGSNSV